MSSSATTLPARSGSTHLNSHGADRRSGLDRRTVARPSASTPPDVASATTRAIFFESLKSAGISQKATALTLGIDAATLSRMATGDPALSATPKLTTEIIDRARVELGKRFRDEFNRRMAAEYGIGAGGDAALLNMVASVLSILDKLAAAQLAGKVA